MVGSEPDLLEIASRPGSVDNDEALVVGHDEQGMMPDTFRVVHPLQAGGSETSIALPILRAATDEDQPCGVLQRKKQLAAERVAFHHLDGDGPWSSPR